MQWQPRRPIRPPSRWETDIATGLPVVETYRDLREHDNLMIMGKGLTNIQGGKLIEAGFALDVWAVNEMNYPFVTAVFEVHGREKAEERGLMERKHPVVTLADWKLPHVVEYPAQQMARNDYPLYFANTIAYMLALGIFLGYERIHIYGVDYLQEMPGFFVEMLRRQNTEEEFAKKYEHLKGYLRRESIWERPCTEFWQGFGHALGCRIMFPNQSTLMMTAPDERRPYGDWGDAEREIGDKRNASADHLMQTAAEDLEALGPRPDYGKEDVDRNEASEPEADDGGIVINNG